VLVDPLDMSTQVDATDRYLAVRVCPVTDGELEPVVAEVLELAAEIEASCLPASCLLAPWSSLL